jgi:hypothetical protein
MHLQKKTFTVSGVAQNKRKKKKKKNSGVAHKKKDA